ncbi:hypothetical protein [Pseudomonas syringae]|uniref:hypothetical protein n=1 Tax=Pseudomonas syringae TaxID=317 RepID=UPI0003523B41|nr:hypothetical protein [Pseudomonas syringae]EPF65937.1 Serine recombinase/resolvase family protein [Pseudomonas syringae pv. syringae SM]
MMYCSFCSVFVSSGGAASNALTPTATIFISGVVAAVAIASFVTGVATYRVVRSQREIASAKIKLDLYNRRFNIYIAALDYHQTAWGKTEKNMTEAGAEFVRAFRESVFLFDDNDGIHKTLEKIKNLGTAIAFYKNCLASQTYPLRNDIEHMGVLKDNSDAAFREFEPTLLVLEQQLAKYISFSSVNGW